MGAYKNKQAVKSLLLTGVVLVVGVVVYMSWIQEYGEYIYKMYY